MAGRMDRWIGKKLINCNMTHRLSEVAMFHQCSIQSQCQAVGQCGPVWGEACLSDSEGDSDGLRPNRFSPLFVW